MPAYNSELYIKEAINSVLQQTYQDFELIIIDDKSTDNTIEIIEFFNDQRISIIKLEENHGVAYARNIGIKKARYPYITFLDSNDLYDEKRLEVYFHYLNNENKTVIYSYYNRFNSKFTKLVKAPKEVSYQDLLKGNFIGNLTGCYNSKKTGKIYQKLVKHEDYLMWLDVLSHVDKAHCIPKPLAYYRVIPGSISSNKFISIYWTWQIYRKYLDFNIFKSIYLFSHNIMNAIIKRL